MRRVMGQTTLHIALRRAKCIERVRWNYAGVECDDDRHAFKNGVVFDAAQRNACRQREGEDMTGTALPAGIRTAVEAGCMPRAPAPSAARKTNAAGMESHPCRDIEAQAYRWH